MHVTSDYHLKEMSTIAFPSVGLSESTHVGPCDAPLPPKLVQALSVVTRYRHQTAAGRRGTVRCRRCHWQARFRLREERPSRELPRPEQSLAGVGSFCRLCGAADPRIVSGSSVGRRSAGVGWPEAGPGETMLGATLTAVGVDGTAVTDVPQQEGVVVTVAQGFAGTCMATVRGTSRVVVYGTHLATWCGTWTFCVSVTQRQTCTCRGLDSLFIFDALRADRYGPHHLLLNPFADLHGHRLIDDFVDVASPGPAPAVSPPSAHNWSAAPAGRRRCGTYTRCTVHVPGSCRSTQCNPGL